MNKKKNQKRKFLDPFFESDSEDEEEDDFFGSDDDFENEFDDMIIKSHFGFSNFGKMHRRLFDRFNQIGDGREEDNEEEEEEEKDERRIRKKRANHFGGFMNFKGDSSGTVISKSYCTKIDYTDGVPHEECYQSQSINQIKDGHKISEKQEAYKNSRTGVQKASHQRVLDDKGIKQIRQRNINTKTQEEHNIFKGMKEEELDDFNENYNNIKNKTGFQKNYKYLNALNNKKREEQKYIETENPQKKTRGIFQYPQLGDGENKEKSIRRFYKKHHQK